MTINQQHNASVKEKFDDTNAYVQGNSTIKTRQILVRQLLDKEAYRSVLDLGCGDGSIGVGLIHRDDQQLTLMDLSENMIERASQNASRSGITGVTTFVDDACTFRSGEEYDVVVCLGVLAHVPSIQQVINTISAHVKPGGHALIQFTEANSLQGRIIYSLFSKASEQYSVNRTGIKSILPMIQSSGLTLIKSKRYSESALGFGRLGFNTAVKFKLFSSRLGIVSKLFSGSLLLLKKA
ncbi:MAG: class I SAM-dependent methyltransferase [Flavobacteriales bacterium]|nr:class I SAM-dependent methyltransferase [Bacteroidota bacterium]MCB9239869.1 class I SAM-dependent methyltransferase [Flavobacteriales bacterium]